MSTQVYINLPVKDLNKSKEFFTKLGFTINPQFTDENSACVVFGESIYAMIMTHETFRRFTKKDIVDAAKATEAINALLLQTRAQVDEMTGKAIKAGGKVTRPPEDLGWMYAQAIEDLDGHQWEFFYMDISKIPKEEKK